VNRHTAATVSATPFTDRLLAEDAERALRADPDTLMEDEPEDGPPLFPLLDEARLADLPDPTYLLDGRLPAWGNTEWFGPPEAGKSLAGLDLALSVAAGFPEWHGVPIHRHGAVAYIYAEGAVALKLRVAAWHAVHPEVTGDLSIRFIPVAVNLFTGDEQKLRLGDPPDHENRSIGQRQLGRSRLSPVSATLVRLTTLGARWPPYTKRG
jgi:hypothetical protein